MKHLNIIALLNQLLHTGIDYLKKKKSKKLAEEFAIVRSVNYRSEGGHYAARMCQRLLGSSRIQIALNTVKNLREQNIY